MGGVVHDLAGGIRFTNRRVGDSTAELGLIILILCKSYAFFFFPPVSFSTAFLLADRVLVLLSSAA